MFKKFAAAAVLATLAASSFAATPGIYAGLDVGSTKIDDSGLGSETSYGAFVGYDLNPNFAIEGGYRRLGAWKVSGADLDLDQAAVSLIGKVPLNNQFNIFARLGYNRLDASAHVSNITASESTSKVLYGLGLGYNFGGNLAGRLEVQKPSSDSTNVSIGLVYSFQ
jgi:OOP family OmpA-OmpF porin